MRKSLRACGSGLSPIHLALGLFRLGLLWRRRTAEWMVYGVTLIATVGLQLDTHEGVLGSGQYNKTISFRHRLAALCFLYGSGPRRHGDQPTSCIHRATARRPGVDRRLRGDRSTLVHPHAAVAEFGHRCRSGRDRRRRSDRGELRLIGLPRIPAALGRSVRPTGGSGADGSAKALVSLLARGPAEYRLRVQAPAAWTLHTADFYFPGWSAWIDDVPVGVSAEGTLGLVSLSVPEGEHLVRIAFRAHGRNNSERRWPSLPSRRPFCCSGAGAGLQRPAWRSPPVSGSGWSAARSLDRGR